MPWTKNEYPVSMKNLPKGVRDKAIDIANALIKETKMKEGVIIATAISRAKDWAANRNLQSEPRRPGYRKSDLKEHGHDKYVTPHKDGWAVRDEGSGKAERIFDTKKEAVQKATQEAKKKNASVTIQRKDGRIDTRVSYNPNRRYKKQS